MRPFILASILLLTACGATPPLPVNKANGQPTGTGQVGAPTGIRAESGGGEVTLGNNRPSGPISVTTFK